MAYSTQADLEALVTAKKVEELSKPEGQDVVVPRVIQGADSEIDLYATTVWPAFSLTECSTILAIEALFSRGGTGKVPTKWAERAAMWRERLKAVGLKPNLEDGNKQTWHAVAYDPAHGERPAELKRLYTGVPRTQQWPYTGALQPPDWC